MTLTNYWWLLIWIFVAGGVLAMAPKRKEIVCGKIEERWQILPAIILVLPYIIWAGFRSDNFGDTSVYRQIFISAPTSISQLGSYLSNVTKDKGFVVLTVIFKSIIGNFDKIFSFLLLLFNYFV